MLSLGGENTKKADGSSVSVDRWKAGRKEFPPAGELRGKKRGPWEGKKRRKKASNILLGRIKKVV